LPAGDAPQSVVRDAARTADTLTIGDVSVALQPCASPQNVPALDGSASARHYDRLLQSEELLHELRWMLQKDRIGQDMLLLGGPGPLKRRLATRFCEMTHREAEFVSLSRDTTESDLKQRREIAAQSSFFVDQSVVRAAVQGRVLVLEGLEKAERNILPLLNNLLENREMSLEDGRFLVAPDRYDRLLETYDRAELDHLGMVRVSPRFRVIALSLPVPPYQGNSLDPPLRSRFQGRSVFSPSLPTQLSLLAECAPSADRTLLTNVSALSQILALGSESASGRFGGEH
jgi:von Willebrand factor A domain-containing protein 8